MIKARRLFKPQYCSNYYKLRIDLGIGKDFISVSETLLK
jgi:hypothetical protein